MAEIDEFRDMWTADRQKYVLVQLNPADPYSAVIFDIEMRNAVIIEDPSSFRAVIDQMREAGVEIASEIPA